MNHEKHGVSAQQMLAIIIRLHHCNKSSVAQKFQKVFD